MWRPIYRIAISACGLNVEDRASELLLILNIDSVGKTKKMTPARNSKNIFLARCVGTMVSFCCFHAPESLVYISRGARLTNVTFYAAHRQCSRDANSLHSENGKARESK